MLNLDLVEQFELYHNYNKHHQYNREFTFGYKSKDAILLIGFEKTPCDTPSIKTSQTLFVKSR